MLVKANGDKTLIFKFFVLASKCNECANPISPALDDEYAGIPCWPNSPAPEVVNKILPKSFSYMC